MSECMSLCSKAARTISISGTIFSYPPEGIHANGSAAEADYLYVYNNIWANSLAFGSQGYPSAIELGGIHAIVENNIFYNQPYSTVTVIGNITNIKIDHNLAYNSGGAPPTVSSGVIMTLVSPTLITNYGM